MPESVQDRELRRAWSDRRSLAEAHARNVRFHVALNVAFALAALLTLKLDGPIYADILSACLFVCGFLTAMYSVRSVRDSEAEARGAADRALDAEFRIGLRSEQPKPLLAQARGITIVLLCFGLFHLTAAVLTVSLTYIWPTEEPSEGEAVALTWQAPACSRFDL